MGCEQRCYKYLGLGAVYGAGAVNRDATSTWEQCMGSEQRCYKYLPRSSVVAVNRDATSTWEQCKGCEHRCYKYLGAVLGL